MRRTALLMICSALLIFTSWGCGRPPQIGADRDSFKAVDALYTAVSLQDPKLLQQCEQTLQGLHTKGKLAKATHEFLESIVAEARAGKWENAQTHLGDFMRGQRR